MSFDRTQLESFLSAYLDGELTDAERAEVEAFLAQDADARQLLDDLRATVAGLKALPRARASDEFADALRAHLERRALLGSESPRRTPRVSPPLPIVRRFAAAAVIALAVTAGYVTWSITRQPPQPLDRYALKDTERIQREYPGEPPANTSSPRKMVDRLEQSEKKLQQSVKTDKAGSGSASPEPGGALPAQPVPPVALVRRDREKDELAFRPKQDADGKSLGLNAQAEGKSPEVASPAPQSSSDHRLYGQTADDLTIKTTTAGAAPREQGDVLIAAAPKTEQHARLIATAPQTEHLDDLVATGPETDKAKALIRRIETPPSAGTVASAAKPQSVALAPSSTDHYGTAATLPVLGPDVTIANAAARSRITDYSLSLRSSSDASSSLNAPSYAYRPLNNVQLEGQRSATSEKFFAGDAVNLFAATQPSATRPTASAPTSTPTTSAPPTAP